jgi:polyhydroxyalkanoate synthase subunit PhaC
VHRLDTFRVAYTAATGRACRPCPPACHRAQAPVAGVISPPGSKYGYWQNPDLPADPDEWFRKAIAVSGSWWPEWDHWVTSYSDGMVSAREPGGGKLEPLEDAPGSYVRVRATG